MVVVAGVAGVVIVDHHGCGLFEIVPKFNTELKVGMDMVTSSAWNDIVAFAFCTATKLPCWLMIAWISLLDCARHITLYIYINSEYLEAGAVKRIRFCGQ